MNKQERSDFFQDLRRVPHKGRLVNAILQEPHIHNAVQIQANKATAALANSSNNLAAGIATAVGSTAIGPTVLGVVSSVGHTVTSGLITASASTGIGGTIAGVAAAVNPLVLGGIVVIGGLVLIGGTIAAVLDEI